MKSKDEFINGVITFMDKYLESGGKVDVELLRKLSDFAQRTEIYKNQKDKAEFEDCSYDDIFMHMCYKINCAPSLAVYCALLCIPFIYEKYIQEGK